jgi:hypothetical protein
MVKEMANAFVAHLSAKSDEESLAHPPKLRSPS